MSILDLGKCTKHYSDIFPCKKNYDHRLIQEDLIVKIYEAAKKEELIFLKVFDKNKLKNEENYDFLMNQINKEKEISKLCNCNHTVKLNKEFETENNIIFEKEYCDCDLKEYIFNNGPFEHQRFDKNNLQIFKEIAIDLAKALKFLYEQGIIHREIKPQSIYLKELKNDKLITKLGNFGSAIYMKEINKTLPMGTILYAAPEILKNLDYDEKCDMWSLGLTLFEIYFDYSPYGFRPNLNRILNVVYSKEKFIFRKSNIPTLDILFKRLLQINPENRMSFQEYYDYVTNENFLKADAVIINDNKKYFKLYEEILDEGQVDYPSTRRCSCSNRDEIVILRIKKIYELVEDGFIPDITSFKNRNLNKDEIFNNIIYYNNNFENHAISINKDSDILRKETNGAFILCTNLNSLNIIKDEILRIALYEKRIVFNVITNVKGYEKDIKLFLNQNKEFKKYINKICIFCINEEKYLKFKKEDPELIYDVTSDIKNVINFIKQFSLKEIKPYPLTKLVTLSDYLNKYKEIHKNIAQFYGNLTKENYFENMTKNFDASNKDKKEGQLKFKDLLTFDLEKDLEIMDKLLLNLYKYKTFYGDYNIWLMKEKMEFYELFLYFTSRFMHCLNSYADSYNQYYKENKSFIFMGYKLYYSNLLSFERAIGKIILLSRFILTTNEEHIAKVNAGRENEKQVYNTNGKFSVMFYITNLYSNEQWISNGIDEHYCLNDKNEHKVLFLPFSFFRVIKVDLDINNYKADIFLETIGKKEILEEKIRLGKEIKYNPNENIMEIS